IGLNNKLYYNASMSVIKNIFVPPKGTTDHFFNIYILKELSEQLEVRGEISKFVQVSEIIQSFIEHGYRYSSIMDGLANLFEMNFLDTDEQLSDIDWKDLPESFNVAVTSKGFYYYKKLCYRFHYLDLILQDTP